MSQQTIAGRPGRFHKAVATHLAQLRENLFNDHDSDVQRLEEEVGLLKAKLANRDFSTTSHRDVGTTETRSDDSNSSRELEDVESVPIYESVEPKRRTVEGSSPTTPMSAVPNETDDSTQRRAQSAGETGWQEPSLFANGNSSGTGWSAAKTTQVTQFTPVQQVQPTSRMSGAQLRASAKASKAMGWIGQAIGSVTGSANFASRSSNVKLVQSKSSLTGMRPSNFGIVPKKVSLHRKSAREDGVEDGDSSSSSPLSDAEKSRPATDFLQKLGSGSKSEKPGPKISQKKSQDSDTVEFKVASAWLKYDGRKTRFGGRVSALDAHSVQASVKAFKEGGKKHTKNALSAWYEGCDSFSSGHMVPTPPLGSMTSQVPALQRIDSSTVKSESCSERLAQLLRPLMLTPSSLKHILWEIVGLVLIMFDAINIPMEVFRPPETWLSSFSLWLPCFFWLADIMVNLSTGYLTADGTRVMTRSLVARRYAMTSLPFDFLLTLCNWVAVLVHGTPTRDGFQGLRIWRALTLLRVLNIVKLAKAPELEGFIAEHIRSEMTMLIAQIGSWVVVLLVTAHFIACAWYVLGRHIVDGGDTTSWVYAYDSENRDVWHRYAFAIHWSLALFAGENIAENVGLAERTFAILIFIFAFLFSAIFVSSITTLMTRLQIIAGKQSSQLNSLRRYLVDKCISSSLTVRILRNAKHSMQEKNRNTSEASVELLKAISEPLRVELHFEVYFPVLSFHPFFKHYNTINPAGMRKVCHHAVSLITLSTGDIFFSEGETPERPRMLWVVSGRVRYYQEFGEESTDLRRGMWLCEATLWTTWLHYCGTLRGASESSLLALDAGKFQKILRPFPTTHARQYGEGFVQHMNTDNARSPVTDLPATYVEYLVAKVFPEMNLRFSDTEKSWGEAVSNSLRSVESSKALKAKSWGFAKSILPFSRGD